MRLDKKNCEILEILQINSRESLTNIAKKVDLSVDSVKKRINKMVENSIFFPKIQLRPRNFGYKNVVDIKIALHNYSKEQHSKLIDSLNKNPFVVELLEISGEWDLSIVIISRDAIDLGEKIEEIRHEFGEIINKWNQSLTTKVYKFEKYDMEKIMGE